MVKTGHPKSGLPAHHADDLRQIFTQIFTLCQTLYRPQKNIRVHGDCHLGNLFFNEQPFFVDLDDCMQAPAMQDLWMLLGAEAQEQQLNLATLMDEYQNFCDFSYSELALIEPLRAMRQVHYMAWLAKRWGDPAFPLHFPWFNSENYWQQQKVILQQQIFRLQEPALSAYPNW